MLHVCPLCTNKNPIFYNENNRIFYKCVICHGIYLDHTLKPDPNEEKLRYETHNNDVNDLRYQKFVSPITSKIIKNFNPNDKGLDFGSGTGPVISKILKDHNYSIDQYDPYFYNNFEILKNEYNYIACCEVIEHFYNPKKDFKLLKKMLLPGGVLYCMTEIYDENMDFHSWYYKNDPTHVFLYQKQTLQWIKWNYNFSKVTIEDRLIIFYN